jgi:hypothetical protein
MVSLMVHGLALKIHQAMHKEGSRVEWFRSGSMWRQRAGGKLEVAPGI